MEQYDGKTLDAKTLEIVDEAVLGLEHEERLQLRNSFQQVWSQLVLADTLKELGISASAVPKERFQRLAVHLWDKPAMEADDEHQVCPSSL